MEDKTRTGESPNGTGAPGRVQSIKPTEVLRRDLEAQRDAAMRQRSEAEGPARRYVEVRIAKLEAMIAALDAEQSQEPTIDPRDIERRVWARVFDNLVAASADARRRARHGSAEARAEAEATVRVVGRVLRCARECSPFKGAAA